MALQAHQAAAPGATTLLLLSHYHARHPLRLHLLHWPRTPRAADSHPPLSEFLLGEGLPKGVQKGAEKDPAEVKVL